MKCVLLLIILFSMSCTKMTELFNSSDPLGTPISRQKDQDEENSFKNSADPVGGITSFFFATAAASESDLPECNTGMIGKIYYVTTGRVFKACTSGGWEAIDVRGPQGEKGEKGDAGSVGAVGAKGDKGDTGATGAAGPSGSSIESLSLGQGEGLVIELSDGSTREIKLRELSRAGRYYKVTATDVNHSDSDSVKNALCESEFGDSFSAAHPSELVYFGPIGFSYRVSTLGGKGWLISEGVSSTNREWLSAQGSTSGSSPVMCVYKFNYFRVTTAEVEGDSSDLAKSTLCQDEFGNTYRVGSREEFVVNSRIVGGGGNLGAKGGVVYNTDTQYGGGTVFSSSSSPLPVFCIKEGY